MSHFEQTTIQDHSTKTAHKFSTPKDLSVRSIAQQLAQNELNAVITFAGQGFSCIERLTSLYNEHRSIRPWIDAAAHAIQHLVDNQQFFQWSGLYPNGFDLLGWIKHPNTRPDAHRLTSSTLSQPLIFITQIIQYLLIYKEGLADAFNANAIKALTGHSQGMMSALLIAEFEYGLPSRERFVEYVQYFTYQGLHAELAYQPTQRQDGTTMASISGINRIRLELELSKLNKTQPHQHAHITIYNTRTRHVISGPAEILKTFHQQLNAIATKETSARKNGQHGGAILQFTWEDLIVGAPYHSPYMQAGLEGMLQDMAKIGFSITAKRLNHHVYSPFDGSLLNDSEDILTAALTAQFIQPVRWTTVIDVLERTNVDYILDFGPSDGVARLSRSILRGSHLRVLAVSEPHDHGTLFTQGAEVPDVLDYNTFAPQLIERPDGQIHLENRYTRLTGKTPIILPGMTPTTVEAGLVAAATNAGYISELAGGGQVTKEIFEKRMEEIKTLLSPGQEIIFNALYLDPYLWGLHLGRRKIVQNARRAGAPICGVTISAGMPPIDEAASLLEELNELGIWLNAFKPGTKAQIDQVIKIAQKVPQFTIFVHLEGGKAGGHHSWEDLDQLLLTSYHKLRMQQNIVLCVGGGIATETRAVELMTGKWAHNYNARTMPVDAVFIGTLAMASAEAATSLAVKQALVDAAGENEWVYTGTKNGGMTSGKSQLNADIYYIENAAALCGRLLDDVVGDEAAIEQRRDEIITALNATAKPYFGDLATMTYADVTQRLFELSAIGQHGPYEDGPWLDHSWRIRAAKWIERCEARLAKQDIGAIHSILDDTHCALDEPGKVLKKLQTQYPTGQTTTLHPADVRFFIQDLCKQPGKPVNFVPVIDANVRRWYKADSLWQAHSSMYTADQVLAIPGPEAVAGLTQVNEPIASLFGRFKQALINNLSQTQSPETIKYAHLSALPRNIALERSDSKTILKSLNAENDDAWFEYITTCFDGPIAAIFGARRLCIGQRSIENPVRALAKSLENAVLTIKSKDHTATEIIYQRDQSDENIQITQENEHIVVRIGQNGAYLTLPLQWHMAGLETLYTLSETTYTAALRTFYGDVLFSGNIQGVDLFQSIESEVVIDPQRLRAYSALTGSPASAAFPTNMAFSLIWEPLFGLLCNDELASGLLNLVHQMHAVEPQPAWPPVSGESLRAIATITSITNTEKGRIIQAQANLYRGDAEVARLKQGFFIRGHFGLTELTQQREETLNKTITLSSKAQIQFCTEHDWITWCHTPKLGDTLNFTAKTTSRYPRNNHTLNHFEAHGNVICHGKIVGTIQLDSQGQKNNPLNVLLDILSLETKKPTTTPRRTLATALAQAPLKMNAFASVSRDLNPIHRSELLAQTAGLDAPIVHGMWGSARLWSFVLNRVAQGQAHRIEGIETTFLEPIQLGESIQLSIERVGLESGRLMLEAFIHVRRHDAWTPATKMTTSLKAPRTAYIFPGQGIQQRGMGMDGYARSRAARQIWDRADVFTRGKLGFSILRIVRDNPKEILVDGTSWLHPLGVLHLTQFTQVAMAVLAQAQIAELKEAGALVEDAITAGHSVGEYNALGAIAGVLPLEEVIDIVYHRGMVMHTLVPRNAQGQSDYKMGVIRPHYAGLTHEQAEELVQQIRTKTNAFIQIVNYNVRGRQYSVTGEIKALNALGDYLTSLIPDGGKPAWIEIPGIDVPFHSDVLRHGVSSFRKTLQQRLPQHIDETRLLDKYIPNLLPKVFSLNKEYIQEVYELTQTEILATVLDDFETWKAQPSRLARTLLIELLAWQFASPVRWIETQELLLTNHHDAIERIIEVGVGYQPTLANMARYSGKLMKLDKSNLQILNIEAEAKSVFYTDTDPIIEKIVEADTKETAQTQVIEPIETVQVAIAGESVQDQPLSVHEALKTLLATQAKIRPDQIREDETIDELFDGVSSRRNQVLMDIGHEFKLAAIDGAHEKPINALSDELASRATSWQGPGPYIKSVQDDAINRVFGRANVSRRDLIDWLNQDYDIKEGLAHSLFNVLAMESREGDSSRGGSLGQLAGAQASDKTSARALIEQAVSIMAKQKNLPLGRRQATTQNASVDAGALRELDDKIAGPDGALMRSARELAKALGHNLENEQQSTIVDEKNKARLELYTAEHGEAYESLITPKFDYRKEVVFESAWAFAQRDVARLAVDVMAKRTNVQAQRTQISRLATFYKDDRIAKTATWYASLARSKDENGLSKLIQSLESISTGKNVPDLIFESTRPDLTIDSNGVPVYQELVRKSCFVDSLWPKDTSALINVEQFNDSFKTLLHTQTTSSLDFKQETALVTGASPGSIALAIVANLLRGGARVVIATTTTTPKRLEFYKTFYQNNAAPGASLHVVPFNQASNQDTDALVQWLFDEVTEQAGANIRVLKRPFAPSIIIPFGALKELGTLDQSDARSQAAIRAMLLGVGRLITGIASRYIHDGVLSKRCHVLLPLSPNHGGFGGDGVYAETKLGLEALMHKWHSEQDAWGKAITLCGAKIGWVRGTGLMDANNPVAAKLETQTNIRTFNTQEMGAMLTVLCSDLARKHALAKPLVADLTGGFSDLGNIKTIVDGFRQEIEHESTYLRQLNDLREQESAELSHTPPSTNLQALPSWPLIKTQAEAKTSSTSEAHLDVDLSRVVVIVGAGEIGPCGSARTRFELEVDGQLSAAGALELAWMTGLVHFEDNDAGGVWIDAETGDELDESNLPTHVMDAVLERVGIRFIEESLTGYDPNKLEVLSTVYLERDFSFQVTSAADAEAFVRADPEHTRATYDASQETWRITRLAGSEIRVPKQARLNRQVAGLIPSGFDFSRYGIPKAMIESVDKVTLFNLVATIDAFISAGLEPEELLSWVHPSRVANTQGSGIGGMDSLRRLYTDHLLGNPRQNDALQETLINVVAAYVVQSYVGSYGAMSHPVAACATAAVSLEDGADKILAGKADFAVTGGFDDIGLAGAIGFSDMSATADTDAMLAMGLAPHQMSRSNDVRRRGFVEAQGGGTLLLARGDIALKHGLPVLGVVGWVGSFGDGIHKSIPAPGLGALAAACGGQDSPLGQALSSFGLTADDIALVYKHDTSTAANDPNENALHNQIQRALGRTHGNPLWVVSQKTLTGHAKGGAAAWQTIGLCQAMASGQIPGNRNLECVDGAMRAFEHIGFTDKTLHVGETTPLRAGLVTSLGFGHVSAITLVLHPQSFIDCIPHAQRESWQTKANARLQHQRQFWADVTLGDRAAFVKRTDRRFKAPDGSTCQAAQESAMLLNPDSRFDIEQARFVTPKD